MYFFTNVGDLL